MVEKRLSTNEPTTTIKLVVKGSMRETITDMAKEQGTTLSVVARNLIELGIEQAYRLTTEPELPRYKEWRGKNVPLPQTSSVAKVARTLSSIIRVEGPVTTSRAFRAYVIGAGGAQVTTKAQESLEMGLNHLLRMGKIEVDEAYNPVTRQHQRTLRLMGKPAAVVRQPGVRHLYKEMPLQELAELIKRKKARYPSMDEEAIMRSVLETYGQKKLTGKAEVLLQAAFQLLENTET